MRSWWSFRAVARTHRQIRAEGHHFTITIADAKLVAQRPDRWTWRVANGEATVSDDGPRTAESQYLIARSPRTIVRGDGDIIQVITELARDFDGRIFSCVYSETVDDPDSPRGMAARARGLAACQSLHVDQRPPPR